MSKLIEGFIPPKTKCPFKDQCQLVTVCKHLGERHTVQYSCAYARVLDKKETGDFPVTVVVKKPETGDIWLAPHNEPVRVK